MNEQEVLDFINTNVRAEKGNRITELSKLTDTSLDSFGITVLFLELDSEYSYFKYVSPNVDPFSTINFRDITIKEVIDKCLS